MFPRRNGAARVRIILRVPPLCFPGFAETIQRVSGRRAASQRNITSADLYRPFLRPVLATLHSLIKHDRDHYDVINGADTLDDEKEFRVHTYARKESRAPSMLSIVM